MTKMLGIEYVALSACAVLLALPLLFGVHVYYPNGSAALFSFEHYVAPLAGLALLAMLTQSRASSRAAFFLRLRMTLSLTLIVFAHFNLKLWAQLVNPGNFDAAYQAMDKQLGPMVTYLETIADQFRYWLFPWNEAYHDVFVGMFVLSILVHSFVGSRSLERLITAIAITLLLGGLAYMVAPALGPFAHETVQDVPQQAMLAFQTAFITSHGAIFEKGGFIMPLAAMPSLHAAHAIVLTWLMWRDCRPLGWLYLLPLIYICTEAVASKWHYLVDIPAGALIAVLSVLLAKLLVDRSSATDIGLVDRRRG